MVLDFLVSMEDYTYITAVTKKGPITAKQEVPDGIKRRGG
jgi:hypothetical protein